MLKIIIGLALGVAIGVVCRRLALPPPAPPVLTGAVLVVAMTLGYMAVDAFAKHRENKSRTHCGGPDGETAHAKADMKEAAS